jgi:DNA-binding response OmpR family regulator
VECRDGSSAVQAIEEFAPDIAVLDMATPGLNGLGVVPTIGASASQTKIVFLWLAHVDAPRRAGQHLPHSAAGRSPELNAQENI